jgi:hypothetical protein
MNVINATKNDLIKRFAETPIDQIKLSYLKMPHHDIQMADIITIKIGNDSRALKSRWGMTIDELKTLEWIANAT